ncbi:DUF4178 domain-containing protein [Micromonospora endophytica]|uniref:DUF4178 domain-containing protein n=1 Tax=Micromonospora endophytica TaxID=515350 RepID=A0A2W2C6B3_9ACTN|nr:DUF4178 domain-containing protein [Micromonospora endophytica]PZF94941.1 DUF4178 domain-containing protein [Micromonospora endophytica]RIW46878.1 DUF4178 domain-containing protein [Micromonospora endophytica]BCJ59288.1 hypothetical protein Jiend_27100 [Micromonospora endophytica]
MDGVTAAVTVLAVLVGLLVVLALARWRRHRPARADGGRDRPGPAAGVSRRRRRGGSPGDPRGIEIGDIVEIGDDVYPVRGTIRLSEGEWRWAQHLFDDPGGRRLSVAESPEFDLVLWHPEPDVAGTPGAPVVEFAGRRYHWHESGQARFTTTGTTGLDPSGTMRYHDYRAPGGARLTFEAYGEAGWTAARGERLDLADVAVHPQRRGS